MKPRTLGYLVLVYAALTPAAVHGLIQGNYGWWMVGDTALWLAFVSGGFGLIFGRAWSRLVLLVAAAVSVVQSIVGLLFFPDAGTPLDTVLFVAPFIALGILPPVVIFVGALRLPAPAAWQVQPSSEPVAKRVVSPRIDLAYGCFAWIALSICALALMSVLPTGIGQVLGMVVGIPIGIATLAVGPVAVVLSILEWRQWPLVTMSAVSASMLLVYIAEEAWQLVGGDVAIIWFVGSTALMVFLCLRWFAFTRRRATQMQETDERGP